MSLNLGFIYKTTDLKNGKIYIGQHKRSQNPKDPNDSNYFGSGKIIGYILKKDKSRLKRVILEECNSVSELNEKEKYWIEHYNSTDIEVGYNLDKGGNGRVVTDEDRKSQSERTKEDWKKPEYRKKHLDAMTDENKEKIRIRMTGDSNPMKDPENVKKCVESREETTNTEEYKEKQSNHMIKFWKENPEFREKHIERLINDNPMKRPEVAKKNEEIQKIVQNSDEVREKRMKTINDPEYRKKMSEITKKDWEDSEYRKNHVDSMNTPEEKERRREIMLGDKNPSKRPEVREKQKIKAKEYSNRPEVREARRVRFLGGGNPAAKKVLCIETGIIYPTIGEARLHGYLKKKSLYNWKIL